MTGADSDDEPVFSVVKGQPTDEELAALVVVFSSARTTTGSDGGARTSGWSSYSRSVRRPFHPGPDAWRLSGRQR
jgi:hypothetical protein